MALILSFNASAGLITIESDKDSYTAGEIIYADIYINNINPELDFLQVDYSFDNTKFFFDEFSWIETFDVFNLGGLSYAAEYAPGTIGIDVQFLSGVTPVLGTSFLLANAEFEALTDVSAPVLSMPTILTSVDFGGNSVSAVTDVPEPATLALFPLLAGLMFIRKRKRKRKQN